MDEKLALEIRLQAIEYVLVHMAKSVCLLTQDPIGTASRLRSAARDKLQTVTIKDAAPEWSDHLSSEFEQAVDRLLADVEVLVAKTFPS